MEELSMGLCLKLREHHKEYNKENNTKVSFGKFLRILQYPQEDINAVFHVMCRQNVKHKKRKTKK